jgi:hypothetical protein
MFIVDALGQMEPASSWVEGSWLSAEIIPRWVRAEVRIVIVGHLLPEDYV